MNEKRFRVRFEQEDGKGEIVNEKGVELTAREVVDLLNEQQDTIFKLQDLCGKSDGENAKLRQEIKKLRKELDDCEKFRYTVFKRLNEEYIKEHSIK